MRLQSGAAKNIGGTDTIHSPRHLEYLDALRGIAILGVILVHSAILTGQRHAIFAISFTGQRGVQLFYMVSAFTLFLSLDSGRAEENPWSNFFIRRFFRIAPLFYLAILANLLMHGRGDLSNLDILSGFAFLNGLIPKAINSVAIGGWSIAIETSFYALVPLVYSRIKTLPQSIALFLVSSVSLGGISFFLSHRAASLSEYFSFLWFPVEFPVFTLGIVAYMTWKQYIDRTSISGARHVRFPLYSFWSALSYTYPIYLLRIAAFTLHHFCFYLSSWDSRSIPGRLWSIASRSSSGRSHTASIFSTSSFWSSLPRLCT